MQTVECNLHFPFCCPLLLCCRPRTFPAVLLQIYDDVYLEVVKCGQVAGIALPAPPSHTPESETCRVYVRFATQVCMIVHGRA